MTDMAPPNRPQSHDAATPRRLRPINSVRTLKRIEERIELMRWSSHETDAEIVPGSLADTFWNSDVPRLIEAAKETLTDADA